MPVKYDKNTLLDLEALGQRLLDDHGLTDWEFYMDSRKKRYGVCRFSSKTIGLTK